MKIAFVVNQLALGGAERQAADVAAALAARGHECTMVSFYGKTLLREELERRGVRVVPLDAGRSYWRGVIPLAQLLRRLDADVVNTHMPLAGAFARVAAVIAHVPTVSTEQIGGPLLPARIRILNELTLNTAHAIICISEEVRRTLHRRTNWYLVARPSVRVIYNTVDLPRLDACAGALARPGEARTAKRRGLGLTPSDFVIANVGRYDEQKGQRYLLEAFPTVLKRVPVAKVVLVGWGDDEADLRARAAALGVADRVTFAVERADAVEIVAAADAFAFPSVYEGLGIALLEAMALRRAVAVTGIPPLTEVVRHGVDGLHVPQRDAGALAAAIIRLADDVALRERLGHSARSRIEKHFDLQGAVSEYEAVFRQVTAHRRGLAAPHSVNPL